MKHIQVLKWLDRNNEIFSSSYGDVTNETFVECVKDSLLAKKGRESKTIYRDHIVDKVTIKQVSLASIF